MSQLAQAKVPEGDGQNDMQEQETARLVSPRVPRLQYCPLRKQLSTDRAHISNGWGWTSYQHAIDVALPSMQEADKRKHLIDGYDEYPQCVAVVATMPPRSVVQ
eukprot:5120981-Amphidinium_carterae.1